jgi:transcriptional regulator with XRE-family HTH domain
MTKNFEKLSIGDRLRYLIEVRGYTQVALAQKIGLTQAAISNLVTDSSRKPSAPTLLKLAAALQANPDWILTGEGEPFQMNTIGARAEQTLIELFRHMDDQSKAAILAAAKAMTRG